MRQAAMNMTSDSSWANIPAYSPGHTNTPAWSHVTQQPEEVLYRALDVTMALALLLALSPLITVACLLVKVCSRGPVLYRQVRVGRYGQPFTLYKLRSMVDHAEKESGPCWAQTRDPRITRIGILMRLTRVDELPQLVNVLRGDMSLVGPRPERPHFVDQLTTVIPNYHERSIVKPGLTGWAQINYPYGASVQDAKCKLSYDLDYVKNRSLFFNLRILIATIPVVLLGRGAR
jgi:lipopolysaccharide/colanic/teichoic acid biosynthesis glycosyltransferase